MLKKMLSLTLIVCFLLTILGPFPQAYADPVLVLPVPGNMINLSSSYEPALIKGLIIHEDNPFLFDFIMDTGHSGLSGNGLKNEGDRLVKYFFASLTIPEKDLWVNLSPYEKDRMIAQDLGRTTLGRDMLAQDYLLKQITASLIYPEKQLGKTFWDRVYAQVNQKFGPTASVPVDTFNKVWIVADKANVYVNRDKVKNNNQLTAYIVGSHLKVLLEEDYLALTNHQSQAVNDAPSTHSPASQIIKEIVLPSLEKEVNEGKNFAALRQIFYSMVLATWYKKAMKQALLVQVYANKGKTAGVEGRWANKNDADLDPQGIYAQYVQAYKKGVFNYIKEDIDKATGQILPRKYFSGGLTELARADEVGKGDFAHGVLLPSGFFVDLSVKSDLRKIDKAMISKNVVDELNKERPKGYPKRDALKSPFYVSSAVRMNVFSRSNPRGWAHSNIDDDPLVTKAEKARLRSEIRDQIRRFAPWTRFVNNMPRNPLETGMTGRGDLGRYGPNPAEDAVVLRYNKDGKLEVLVEDREDSGGIALPGALLSFGEENLTPGAVATRRLYEETNATIDMSKGTVVYEGPSGDWRDTNDAWVITRGIAVVLSYEESLLLNLQSKEGVKPHSVRFVSTEMLDGFYARHKTIIKNAVAKVEAGVIKTTEESRVKSFAPLNITMPQIERAYQLFKEGKTELVQTFDVTIPKAPHGGNYVVMAGVETTLNDIRRLRFLPEHIQALRDTHYFSDEFLEFLSTFQFQGDISAVQEGRMVQEGIPVMRLKANEVEMELLSALLKNRIGQACNVATKTARIVQAANGDFISEEIVAKLFREQGLTRDQIKKVRDVIDMGLRRGQGEGAFLASLYAVTGGAIGTSNEEAGNKFDLETMGSIAHAFIQMFPPEQEIEAFRLYASLKPKRAIFLPDTNGDTLRGTRHAITVMKEMEARGEKAFGIRLDSGDMVTLSKEVRRMLDAEGLSYIKILASDSLDEQTITLYLSQGARIDMFGVGTSLITGGKQGVLDVQIRASDTKRYWRSMVKGQVEKYITTPAGQTAYAKAKQQISELLMPIWRGGKRVRGVEQSWSAHERAINEMGRMAPGQKALKDGQILTLEHQENDLTINKDTDIVLYVDDEDAFKTGGLPVAGGNEIAKPIQESIELFDPSDRYYSLDQHERGSISWVSSFEGFDPYTVLTYDLVKDWTDKQNQLAPHAKFTVAQLKDYLKRVGFQVLWPEHADKRLAESRLPGYINPKMLRFTQIKGMKPTVDSYSPFEDNLRETTGLAEVMRRNKPGVKRVFLGGGLAFDYCVGFAALGAVKNGFEVILLRDATRSVGVPAGNAEAMEKMLLEKGVKIIDSTDLLIAANNTKGVYPAPILEKPITHPPLLNIEKSSALAEDTYHLTMANALFNGGYKDKTAVFGYFYRKAPYGGDRVFLSGLRVLADRLRNFKFTDKQIEYLRQKGVYSEDFLEYLRNFEFTGDIDTLDENSVGFANEELFKVRAPVIEGLIIESLILNKLNFNSLITTKTSLERAQSGEDERLYEDGLTGAQGESHAEASLSAFYGGVNATTNIDAHLKYKIPLAWSNDEGRALGADLVTGGDQPALAGVYKIVLFDEDPRIKVSEDLGKTIRPGDKDIVDIEDANGNVVERINAIVGEKLELPQGHRAVIPYIPFARKGGIVYVPKDPFEVQARGQEQAKRYADIHESRMSPGLAALRQGLIEKSLGAKASAKTDSAMNGGIDLDAGKMTLTQTGDRFQVTFDEGMIGRFKKGDFSGVTPVIVRVAPLSDVASLLGLKE